MKGGGSKGARMAGATGDALSRLYWKVRDLLETSVEIVRAPHHRRDSNALCDLTGFTIRNEVKIRQCRYVKVLDTLVFKTEKS